MEPVAAPEPPDEEFVAIAQTLKDKLMKGIIVPSSEYEIPKLIYSQASV